MILFVNKTSYDNPYILIINCDDDESERKAIETVSSKVKKHVVKSKTVSATDGIEVTVEIRLKDMTTQFANEISKVQGVRNAVLVSYNGDYMG